MMGQSNKNQSISESKERDDGLLNFGEFEEFEELEPSTWERFSSKFKEQPLVPIGAGATTIALLGAGRAIQQGNSSQFNLWLRYRVIFQGLTVAAALVGSLYYTKQRQIDRVALEEERIRKRDLRIREQESSDRSFSGSDQKVGSGVDLSGDRTRNDGSTSSTSEFRRELMRKKISDQAKLEGKPLRSFGSGHQPSEP